MLPPEPFERHQSAAAAAVAAVEAERVKLLRKDQQIERQLNAITKTLEKLSSAEVSA